MNGEKEKLEHCVEGVPGDDGIPRRDAYMCRKWQTRVKSHGGTGGTVRSSIHTRGRAVRIQLLRTREGVPRCFPSLRCCGVQ
jgi:hypothetical protein